ncbi:dTMP kinase [Pseudogulbenkiania sp. NH8B]|uniref:Thymidylate kinase n=1 Tax=Pseudogulbenkiania ferrooxidans 2002 TaxID=279714 RepID=B9Z1T2_9NEIS|nr:MULTISPECIES: dTMP kinase [Pseudogulbenkiania]EEG09377.1 dTMP kinase [Pseudogulbenkiania ferrooxidans 2002]BAK75573.1 dTMP kinase [Pseudogulbenkiania sp. NH8B]
MRRGTFITLEGVDGAGKSTQLAAVRDWLAEQGIDAVFTREPGGTVLGEKLRELLLAVDTEVTLETETLLMFAARQEHIARVIEPALAAGRWVVSDRFTDATFAYQGGGRGLPFARIEALEDWVQQGLQPDLTLLFDVPLDVAARRMAGGERVLDRFEQEAADFHARVRAAYLQRASANPRIAVVDANRSPEQVRAEVMRRLDAVRERR